MPRSIKGGRVKSIKSLKAGLKRSEGGGYLTRVPENEPLTVRFLTEPNEWVEYFEHYDDVRKFYPCTDDGCPGCLEGERPSKRYLTNAVDTSDNKVVPLVLAKSLAGIIMKMYDKFNTLLDRDYELSREGSGFDTEYSAIPEPPSKMNLRRFEELDLWSLLEAQLAEDDEEDDDEDTTPKRRSTGKRTPPRGRTIADDDDDEEDDEDERPVVRRRPMSKTAARKPSPAARRPLKK